MKRTIQAVVVASLFAGAQAALSFPSSGDDYITQVQSSYADQYADKGAPAMAFPSSGDDVLSVGSSTYADRHAGEVAQAPMEFPSAGDDVIAWTGTSPAPTSSPAARPQ